MRKLAPVPLILLVPLAIGCVPARVPTIVPPSTPTARPVEAARLAELPPIRFIHVYDEAVRPRHLDDWYRPRHLWADGVLVRVQPGEPPLETGDRLALVLRSGDIATLVVTDARCAPTALDCLSCDTRWATRVAGPMIDSDDIVTAVGPVVPGVFEFAMPSEDGWFRDGLVVTHDGVKLTEATVCTDSWLYFGDCVTSTAFVLGAESRELSRWPRSSAATLQLFELLAWPGRQLLTREKSIGGPDQIVIGQWIAVPEIPVRDASYWLVGPTGIVGSVRFDAPHAGTFCGFFYSNPCWSTKVVDLPPPNVGVWFVVGPITDSIPPTSDARLEVRDDGHLDFVIGAPDRPSAKVTSREFPCLKEGRDQEEYGVCFETVTETRDAATRTVTFLSVEFHHARPETVCVERSPSLESG